jgi:hypothetical protein
MEALEDDEPVTLAEACRLFFGDRLSPSALRTEAAKGNLDIMQIARKDFVTRRAIEEMKFRCTRPARNAPQHEIGREQPSPAISAQQALRMRLQQRRERKQ